MDYGSTLQHDPARRGIGEGRHSHKSTAAAAHTRLNLPRDLLQHTLDFCSTDESAFYTLYTMLRTAIAFASMIAAARALPAADEITALPGWTGALPSRQFSGYLDASPTKHLHYWMSFSEGAPETDPVVFWFNGGPGCSSLDGFLYEHGPFRVQMAADGATSLAAFEYSWAKLANMVYLEAPCGVGFSYSDVGGDDYAATDDTAAADNLRAVEAFYVKFPEFANRSLYLTGESYAGICACVCLLYTSPSPRDGLLSRMPSSA